MNGRDSVIRPGLRCLCHLNHLGGRLGCRDGFAVFTHPFDMKLDGLSDFFQQLFPGARRSDASGKGREHKPRSCWETARLRWCISWAGLLLWVFFEAVLAQDAAHQDSKVSPHILQGPIDGACTTFLRRRVETSPLSSFCSSSTARLRCGIPRTSARNSSDSTEMSGLSRPAAISNLGASVCHCFHSRICSWTNRDHSGRNSISPFCRAFSRWVRQAKRGSARTAGSSDFRPGR